MPVAAQKEYRVVTGPEAVKAMDRLNRMQDQRDQWPYPWLCPPDSAEPVFRAGAVLSPAVATETLVLEYSVPAGLRLALCSVVQVYVGAGFVPGSGDILWTTDMDSPVGVTALMGTPLPGLFRVPIPLGDFSTYPWRFDKPFILEPNQVLRSKVITAGGIPQGAPNYFVSVFSGFTWPV